MYPCECQHHLQVLVFSGLAVPTLNALAKISEQDETGEALTSLVRDVNSKYAAGDASVQVPVGVRLWKTPGCHEFLASLGKSTHHNHMYVYVYHFTPSRDAHVTQASTSWR